MKIKLTEAQVKFLAGALAGMIEAAGNDVSHETPKSILYSLSGILPVLENEWEKIGWPQRSLREMLAEMPGNFLDAGIEQLKTAAATTVQEIFPKRKNQA